jgi:hypothetical protein
MPSSVLSRKVDHFGPNGHGSGPILSNLSHGITESDHWGLYGRLTHNAVYIVLPKGRCVLPIFGDSDRLPLYSPILYSSQGRSESLLTSGKYQTSLRSYLTSSYLQITNPTLSTPSPTLRFSSDPHPKRSPRPDAHSSETVYFTFQPTADSSKSSTENDTDEDSIMAMDEEKEDVRKAALVFMISLSRQSRGAAAIVRGCPGGSANSAMITSIFGWKLTFVLLNFSVVRRKLTSIGSQPRKIQRATHIRMCTSNRSTDSRVPWAARPCSRQHSNTYPACSLVATGG